MKKMIVLMLAVGLVATASAQYRGHVYAPAPRVIITSPYYGFGYPYYGYPIYRPYGYSYPQRYRASRLDEQIATIRHDYDQKIASVKMDKSLRGRQRRQQVRMLKKDRDYAIDMAKRNYYKQ